MIASCNVSDIAVTAFPWRRSGVKSMLPSDVWCLRGLTEDEQPYVSDLGRCPKLPKFLSAGRQPEQLANGNRSASHPLTSLVSHSCCPRRPTRELRQLSRLCDSFGNITPSLDISTLPTGPRTHLLPSHKYFALRQQQQYQSSTTIPFNQRHKAQLRQSQQ